MLRAGGLFVGVRRSLSSVAAEGRYLQFNVSLRDEAETGTAKSMKMRKEDRIPGVVYGTGRDGTSEEILVTCNRKELHKEIRQQSFSVENVLYHLHIDDKPPELVTIRQIQVRAGTEYIVSVNFLRFQIGRVLRIPLTYLNEEQNVTLKRGGIIRRTNDFVPCVCETEDVPRELCIDASEGGKGRVFRYSDIMLPDGLTMKIKDQSVPVGVIQVPRRRN